MTRFALTAMMLALATAASAQTPAPAPLPNSTLAAPAPQADPAPPSLETVLSLRDIGGYRRALALSPNGARLAVVVSDRRLVQNDYRNTLVVIDTHTGAAREIAELGDIILETELGKPSGSPIDNVPLWSPDGRWIAYLRRVGDEVQLWRIRANGRDDQRVASEPGDVRRFAWTADSAGLVFEMDTPRAELEAEQARAARAGFRVDARFDPQHSLMPLPDLTIGRKSWVWRGGSQRPAAEAEAALLEGPASSFRTAMRGRASAVSSASGAALWADTFIEGASRRAPFGVFYQAGPEAPTQRCADALCQGRIEEVWWGGEGEAFFLRIEGPARAYRAVYAWRPSGGAVRLLRREEGVIKDCQPSPAAAFCIHEATLQPPRIVRIDHASGAMTPLYDPNPLWSDHTLPRFGRIDVADLYGNGAMGYLFYPYDYDPRRPHPVVIVQYRARGFLRGGTGGEYPVYEFARRGYFVLNVERPNLDHLFSDQPFDVAYRRSELENLEHHAKQSALEALLALLAPRGDVDMERIAITGLSDGAETVFWAITHSDAFAVAVAATPPIDPLGWALASEQNRARLMGLGLGPDRDGTDPAWRRWWGEMSASYRIDRITAPVLMQLSENETLRAFPFYAHMRAQNRPVELYIYPGAYHIKSSPAHLLASQRRTADWIDFWLKGVLNPDPNDPDRATRWHTLREAHEARRAAAAGGAS